MAGPSSIDQSDWLTAAVALIIASFGWLMGWMRTRKKEVDDRFVKLEKDMSEHDKCLAVVQTCQVNTAERLVEIKETTADNNAKLDRLSETLTQVLLEMKHKG